MVRFLEASFFLCLLKAWRGRVGWFLVMLWSFPPTNSKLITPSLLGWKRGTIISPIFPDLHRVMQQARVGAGT